MSAYDRSAGSSRAGAGRGGGAGGTPSVDDDRRRVSMNAQTSFLESK